MKKKEVIVPESLGDISLSKWQKYMLMVDEKTDQDFANRKALDIFYDIDSKDYNSLRVKDVEYLIEQLNKALATKQTLKMRFELDGVEYGFIPDMDDITFGEFIDLDKYSTVKDYHRLMSILFRPITKTFKDRYLISKYKGSHEKLSEMPLSIALGAVGFFFDIGLQLTKSTLKSLKVTDQEQKKKRDLALSGLGILQSIPYQMPIFSNSMK